MTTREREGTYIPQVVITGPELRLDCRRRAATLKDRLAALDPSLGGSLAEVDLLAFMTAGVGIEKDSLIKRKESQQS